MRIFRGHIVCREIKWKVSAEKFRKENYGWSRTEVAEKMLKEVGIEVTDFRSIQVIPVDRDYLIVLREQ